MSHLLLVGGLSVLRHQDHHIFCRMAQQGCTLPTLRDDACIVAVPAETHTHRHPPKACLFVVLVRSMIVMVSMILMISLMYLLIFIIIIIIIIIICFSF